MKKITLVLLFLLTLTLKGQYKINSAAGITSFEASIPSFEEVKAVNKKTNCTVITSTGELICWLYIKDFDFKRNLMQEHFNTIYMESNRYPKAIFKGKIKNLDIKNLTSTNSFYQLKGKISIKGKTKIIATQISLKRVQNGLEFSAEFPLNTDDFNIAIPFIVRTKISKTVNTQITCVMK
jgi:hypothetical protein